MNTITNSNSRPITYFFACITIIMLSISPCLHAQKLGDLGKAWKKGKKDFRRTLKKAEKDFRRETGKAIHNTIKETGKALTNVSVEMSVATKNIEAETRRVGPHTLNFTKAMGNYLIGKVSGADEMINAANQRILQGKLADAFFHLALDPLTKEEELMFKATQESGWIRSAGAIAAQAYGGPGGAAAYAAWQTYRATNSAEMAIKAGLIAGFTSEAMSNINAIKSVETFDVVKKSVLAGSVGGLAIALSGGDETSVLEGFVLAGGMVLIQEGYQSATGHALDPRAATKDPYCATPGPECDVFKRAYYIDENGALRIDYSKLDPRASYVGEGYNLGEQRPPYSWTQDRSTFMKTVAKLPGFNAMGMFHDNWVLSWQMSDIANKATIFPAIVLTYYGAGAPLATSIIDANTDAARKEKEARIISLREQLKEEPSVVYTSEMTDNYTPENFNVNKDELIPVSNVHVAQTNLTSPGKYLILRNIANGRVQRVLVTGALPVLKPNDKTQLLISPRTMRSLGVEEHAVVQAETEDFGLVSTVEPDVFEIEDGIDYAYFKKGDTLTFPVLDTDIADSWSLAILGPSPTIMENYDNKWANTLKSGKYTYMLQNTSPGQFPWGYFGFIKILGEEPAVELKTDENAEAFIQVGDKKFAAYGECLGNTISVNAEDAGLLLLMNNVKGDRATINGDYFEKGCKECLALSLFDTNTSDIIYCTKGSYKRSGNKIEIEGTMKQLQSGKSFKIVAQFVCEE